MPVIAKLLTSALIAFSLLLPGVSQASGPATPLLWRLNTGGSTVYLLGSFHMLRADDYPLASEIDLAFADAERVVFEVHPAELASAAAMQQALRHARLSPAAQAVARLPDNAAATLAALLAERGVPAAQLAGYQPWFTSARLVMDASRGLGFSHELGLDKHLMARAAAAGKAVAGLESLDAQLQALGAAPLQEQLGTLAALVAAPHAMADGVARLHEAWRSGDAERLDRDSRAALAASAPGTYRAINVERNRAWLPAIQSMLDRPAGEDVLVVVGAMHLLGRDGLVSMLHERGLVAHRVGGDRAPALAAGYTAR